MGIPIPNVGKNDFAVVCEGGCGILACDGDARMPNVRKSSAPEQKSSLRGKCTFAESCGFQECEGGDADDDDASIILIETCEVSDSDGCLGILHGMQTWVCLQSRAGEYGIVGGDEFRDCVGMCVDVVNSENMNVACGETRRAYAGQIFIAKQQHWKVSLTHVLDQGHESIVQVSYSM